MHPSVVVAVIALLGALLSYGGASLLLADHSDRVRSVGYLAGLTLQGAAFVLSFVARTQLPLILVQATISASVAVTAVGGMLLGRWRLGRGDIAALAAVVGGIAAVGAASEPGPAGPSGWTPLVVIGLLGAVSVAWLLWSRRRADVGTPLRSAAWLGVLAGVNFGSSAIAARMLAADPLAVFSSPIGVAHGVVLVAGLWLGQVQLTLALRHGQAAARRGDSQGVTLPISAMYIAGTLWPAAAGLAWLDDALVPGREGLAALGVAIALVGVGMLTRMDQVSQTVSPTQTHHPG